MAGNGKRIQIYLVENNKWVQIGKGRPHKAVHQAVEFFVKHYYISRDTICRLFWKFITDPEWRKYPLLPEDLDKKVNKLN